MYSFLKSGDSVVQYALDCLSIHEMSIQRNMGLRSTWVSVTRDDDNGRKKKTWWSLLSLIGSQWDKTLPKKRTGFLSPTYLLAWVYEENTEIILWMLKVFYTEHDFIFFLLH